MRIVAGKYGGRKLYVPKNYDVRPTSDKVRGAIFNALGSMGAVDGAVVIDAFCGTGALGIEALSRGAAQCVFIDKARVSLDLARENIRALGADNDARFILKATENMVARGADVSLVDLVFLDPPYHKGLAEKALAALIRSDWLAKDCVVVIEAEKAYTPALPPEVDVLNERLYGDTKVVFARLV
jgi:16S rRNA (guanine966-N2)-methyltransferase